jgi:sulfate permease, SulP family
VVCAQHRGHHRDRRHRRDALENLRRELANRNIVFGLARLKTELRQTLAAAGFLNRIGEDRVYATLPTAVEAYQKWCRAQPPGED